MERVKTVDTLAAEARRAKALRDLVPTAARKYCDMFFIRYGKRPLAPIQMRLIEAGRSGGWDDIFLSIVKFLEDLRKEHKAHNPILSLLTDYYNHIFEKFKYANRVPTIKQISPGTKNSSTFISFIVEEEMNGSPYWISKEDSAEAQRLIAAGGTKFFDPIAEAARALIQKKGDSGAR